MKKILTTLIIILFALPRLSAQNYFFDDFDSYKVKDYLANQSKDWTTWSNAPGTPEDAMVDDNQSSSGSQSIYFESSGGGGPIDLILPFGGVHNSGRFKFSSKWYVPAKSGGAYFNFQGDTKVGGIWALEVYMYDNGTIQAGKYINNSYPQDQWFELVVDIDFDNNVWEMLIDGNSLGTWSNPVNQVSFLDIFSNFTDTRHWVDDVSFCVDNACASDLSLNKLTLNPNPICSNHGGDITVNITNNGPQPAKGFTMGIDVDNQARILTKINLNGLTAGRDTTITITGVLKIKSSGAGQNVSVTNATGDKDPSNDVASTNIDVLPSPSGFEIARGTNFEGRYKIGDVTNPDLVEAGKTNTYDLVPGPGFTNSNYSSKWSIDVVATTTYGIVVPPSAYTVVTPTGGSNAKIIFKGSSTYYDSVITFTYIIRNAANGCDSSVSRMVRVVPTPELNFKFPSAICLGDDVPFQNLSTIHSGIVTYTWQFGDGDSSDVDNPFHVFNTAKSYNVRLFARSHPYDILKDTTITITVNEIPAVKFRVNNKCEGAPVEFVNQSTVGSGTLVYDWDFGDNSAHGTTQSPTHQYTKAGGFKVSLKATSNGCAAKLTKNAYTFARPKANFTIPSSSICSYSDVILPNTTTLASGNQGAIWNFGDGESSTVTQGTHAYKAAGTYLVKLVSISEFECKDSITKSVTVKPSPEPDFAGNQFCGKTPTVFTNKTVEALPSTSYSWTFSDNFTANTKNVTRAWPIEGPYSATLKADYTNGCSGTVTKDFTVAIQPKANFSVTDICSGETAKFVNKSEGDKAGMDFLWNFGNNTFSTNMAPVNTYSPPTTTTYTVTLVVSYPAACSDTFRKNITVSEAPVCDFTFKELGLLNTQFTPSNSTYSKYEWFFGDGGTSLVANPKYKFSYDGNFYVTMKATNAAGCMCESTKKVGITTSVNSIDAASGISIYPNPNNGAFTVKNVNGDNMNVEVFTILGTKIYSHASDGELLVNLQDYAKGIYVVKVTMNGVTSTARITVN